jgi:hypothetical protein
MMLRGYSSSKSPGFLDLKNFLKEILLIFEQFRKKRIYSEIKFKVAFL